MIVSRGNADAISATIRGVASSVLGARRLGTDVEQADELALECAEHVPQPAIVERVALEQGMNLHAPQAVVTERAEIVLGRAAGMHGAESDEPLRVKPAHEGVGRLQALGGVGHGQAHVAVDAGALACSVRRQPRSRRRIVRSPRPACPAPVTRSGRAIRGYERRRSSLGRAELIDQRTGDPEPQYLRRPFVDPHRSRLARQTLDLGVLDQTPPTHDLYRAVDDPPGGL